MKYSLIMPYYKRAAQLENTLRSFLFHYGDRSDWEVVLIEDCKNTDKLADVIQAFSQDMQIVHCVQPKETYNPSPAFNLGVNRSSGEFIVLTNPECLHFSDVLGVFDSALADDPTCYVVAACLSIRESKARFDTPAAFRYERHAWYQHTQEQNNLYHFCSVLARSQFLRLGGFDERFAGGIAYDDNDFLRTVKTAGITVLPRDDALVLHQKHGKLSAEMPRAKYRALLNRNKKLFEDKCKLQSS